MGCGQSTSSKLASEEGLSKSCPDSHDIAAVGLGKINVIDTGGRVRAASLSSAGSSQNTAVMPMTPRSSRRSTQQVTSFLTKMQDNNWLHEFRESATTEQAVDIVYYGRFGKDQEDEQALAVCVALRCVGIVDSITVITNSGDTKMRARLAKGTLEALGAGQYSSVGAGSDGGLKGEDLRSYDFPYCNYLASEDKLESMEGGACEIFFAALAKAKAAGRTVCVVLNGPLTDFALAISDERWNQWGRAVVDCISTPTDVLQTADGTLVMDPTARNNMFDLASAECVYTQLAKDASGPHFIAVSTHAAASCQLPRSALECLVHPVARRFASVTRAALQKLWERVNLSPQERERSRCSLPLHCDRAWFMKHFMQTTRRSTLLTQKADSAITGSDDIWPHVTGMNTHAALAIIVVTCAKGKRALLKEFFVSHKCPRTNLTVIGGNERSPGVTNVAKASELMHDLMTISFGGGNGDWVRKTLRDVKRSPGSIQDMIMVGDFGKDQDDEKALAIAVSLRCLGVIGDMSVIANLGDAHMRARLAKGTLTVLGAIHARVAAGSDAGRKDEDLSDCDWSNLSYLAEKEELWSEPGHELFFSALSRAKAADRKVCVVLNSACTDFALVISDVRWKEWGRDTVSCVVAMGGLLHNEDGKLVIDPTAQNNAFDVAAAEQVYTHLAEDHGGPPFIVVSRHAASACQLPCSALNGSEHPVAQRLAGAAKPALQKLWERVHVTEEGRKAAGDKLPIRCDPIWFRSTFLLPNAPEDMGPEDDVWPQIRGFNEYDGLAVIVAAVAGRRPLFEEFFLPVQCAHTSISVIGLDAKRHGIINTSCASEMLNDLMVLAFERGKEQMQAMAKRTHHAQITLEGISTDRIIEPELPDKPPSGTEKIVIQEPNWVQKAHVL